MFCVTLIFQLKNSLTERIKIIATVLVQVIYAVVLIFLFYGHFWVPFCLDKGGLTTYI